MNSLISLIPQSFDTLIGLAVVMGLFIMGGTFFQEWAKALYRKLFGKNRRHSEIEEAITHFIQTLDANTGEMQKFITLHTEWQRKMQISLQETSERMADMHRKQERNWKQLFEDELPRIEKKTHGN